MLTAKHYTDVMSTLLQYSSHSVGNFCSCFLIFSKTILTFCGRFVEVVIMLLDCGFLYAGLATVASISFEMESANMKK